MCIIVCKPKGKFITRDIIQNCFKNNDDGAGYMFAENDRLVIRKPFYDFNTLYKSLIDDNCFIDKKTVVFHFRIKTHGVINKSNTHPHRINDNLAVVHNGVFSEYGGETDNLSDTAMFCNYMLKPMATDVIQTPQFVKLLDLYVRTHGSRMILMDNKGSVVILNESSGIWDNGSWFSNSSYKPTKPAKTNTTVTTSTNNDHAIMVYNKDTQFTSLPDGMTVINPSEYLAPHLFNPKGPMILKNTKTIYLCCDICRVKVAVQDSYANMCEACYKKHFAEKQEEIVY